MRVLIDTPVWSEYLRRTQSNLRIKAAIDELVRRREVAIIGPVRLELLSGIRDRHQFQRLRAAMRVFMDEPIFGADYEHAAELSNLARIKGIQGSATDLLLCAVSMRLIVPIFTLDEDFKTFASLFDIRLFPSA